MTRSLRIVLLSSLSALALAGCGDTKTDPAKEQEVIAKVAAPASKSWSQTVTRTAEGGYVMGNPDASIKIIEFASLTCPHCAEFSKESHEEIKRDFIDTGRVSLEVRNFIRDPLDATAAAVVHCVPAERYYPLLENVFATQEELYEGVKGNEGAAEAAMKLPPAQRFPALAKALKIDQFFQSRGISAEQLSACLGKVENITTLEKNTNAAIEKYQVQGTPTFLINGQVAEGVATWPLLRDRLRTMGAR
ncbi:protein-disulfide isomerase [Sphingopyxis panaciterrae]|uniref:thioredoxin domain-containing protein n=1 Tax=Sphingopyxis panaciterrae TaxID=363841 RepID=UPI001422C540|nr:thioredoxin domain-containing protein [Sphingopyxis panaciterrae]NIJ37869.1 protein-disulfide isomerase [Sphingopyxis panaciterrae]